MGVGSFCHGGSSSSSSKLSPLAQPFTIDRPNPSSTLSPHFDEASSSSSSSSFSYPSSSVPISFSDPNSTAASIPLVPSLPSPSQSISSANFHLASANCIPTASSCACPYDQSSETATASLVGAPPYYPQYQSAVIHDGSPSVVVNESSLSSSNVAILGGSFQADYCQSLYDLGYLLHWGDCHNGQSDGEQPGRVNLDGSFIWRDNNCDASLACQSLLNQGALAVWDKTCIDIVGHNIGSKGTEQDAKCPSSAEERPKLTPLNIKAASILDSTSTLQEMPYPQVTSISSVMNSWCHLDPGTASFGGCFTQPAAATMVFGSPAIRNSYSSLNKISLKRVKSYGKPVDAFDSNEDSTGLSPFNKKEPHIRPSVKLKEGYHNTIQTGSVGGSNLISVESFTMNKDVQSNQRRVTDGALDNLLKAKSEPAPSGAEAGDSVENSSDTFDQIDPDVDSPCWKGTLASSHSPCRAFETVAPQPLVKELEACNGLRTLNVEGPQIFSAYGDQIISVSSPKLQENLVHRENGGKKGSSLSFKELPHQFLAFPCVEHRLKVPVKAGPYHSEWNGIHCSDQMQEPIKEKSLPYSPKCSHELGFSHKIQPNLEVGNSVPARWIDAQSSVADTGMDIKDAVQVSPSCEQFYATGFEKQFAGVGVKEPCRGATNNSAKHHTPTRIDVRSLLHAMSNLSELLLSGYSNDIHALQEHDHEILQYTINNLKEVGQMHPLPELRENQLGTPQPGIYCSLGTSDLHKDAGIGKSQKTRIDACHDQNQHGYQSATVEGKRLLSISSKKDDILQLTASLYGNANTPKDNDMAQATKKVLVHNLMRKY